MDIRAPTRRLPVALAVVALLLAAVTVPAAGAGQTNVRLIADTDEVPVDGTTTIAVVATNVDGGVGAYNLTVSLETDHARIANASTAGGAGFERIEIADDGSSALILAALLNTTDTGSATIATVTVEGAATGRSDLSLEVTELADEAGQKYRIGDTNGVSLTVTAPTPSPTATAMTATDEETTTDSASSEAEGGAEATSPESGDSDGTSAAALGSIERIRQAIPLPVVGGLALVGVVVLGVFVRRRR